MPNAIWQLGTNRYASRYIRKSSGFSARRSLVTVTVPIQLLNSRYSGENRKASNNKNVTRNTPQSTAYLFSPNLSISNFLHSFCPVFPLYRQRQKANRPKKFGKNENFYKSILWKYLHKQKNADFTQLFFGVCYNSRNQLHSGKKSVKYCSY
jgi:hypothetical protein